MLEIHELKPEFRRTGMQSIVSYKRMGKQKLTHSSVLGLPWRQGSPAADQLTGSSIDQEQEGAPGYVIGDVATLLLACTGSDITMLAMLQ